MITDLSARGEHQQDFQALHMHWTIQQLHSFIQIILSTQWNHKLQEREKVNRQENKNYGSHISKHY